MLEKPASIPCSISTHVVCNMHYLCMHEATMGAGPAFVYKFQIMHVYIYGFSKYY